MKKILIGLLMMVAVHAHAQDAISKTLHGLNDVAKIKNKSANLSVVLDSGNLYGRFNLVDTTGLKADGGIIFGIPGAPKFLLQRDISASVWINVKWFGAKADYDTLIASGTNNTAAFQNAIDFAYKNLARATVFVPAGSYYVDSIFIPAGISFIGENGMNEGFRRSGTKLFQGSNKNHSLITCYNPEGSSTQLLYWYGRLADFSLQASVTNDTGYAISFRQRGTGEPVGLQDMNEIRNITIRNFKSGGIEMPNSLATPGCFYNIKALFCGGPAFVITNPYTTNVYSASLTFINCNSDGCLGGMFYLKGLKKNQNIVIINTRQEQRRGNPFNGSFDGGIGIVADNCDSTLISVMGYRIAGGVDTAGVLLRPGNFVKIIGNKAPRITWSGVNIRIRPNDIGPIPELISGTGILWDRTYGWWPVYLNGEFIVNQFDSKQNGNAWFNKAKLDSINIGTQATPTAPFYSNRPFRFDLSKDSSGFILKRVDFNDQNADINTLRVSTINTVAKNFARRFGINFLSDYQIMLHNAATNDSIISAVGGLNQSNFYFRHQNEADASVSLAAKAQSAAVSLSNYSVNNIIGLLKDTSVFRGQTYNLSLRTNNIKTVTTIADNGFLSANDDVTLGIVKKQDTSYNSTFTIIEHNAMRIVPMQSANSINNRAIWQEGINDSNVVNSAYNYFRNLPTTTPLYLTGLDATGKLVKLTYSSPYWQRINGTLTPLTTADSLKIGGTLKVGKTPVGSLIDSILVKASDSSIKAIAPLPPLPSGNYTATLTNTANITSSSFDNATYTRQGDVVTVRISGTVTPASPATLTRLTFTLPVNPGGATQYRAGTIMFSDNAGDAYFGGHVDVNASSGEAYFISGPTNTSGNFVIQIQYAISHA